MNWDQIQWDWRQLKGKVKANWGDGRREELLGRLHTAYRIGKSEAEQQLEDF